MRSPYSDSIDDATYQNEANTLEQLVAAAALSEDQRSIIVARAAVLVEAIRGDKSPGIMEAFLAEYGLSTDEGVALMCLAEALLRVPDHDTIDALIEDKIAPSDWGKHLGSSTSSLVNASTWGLMLTGRVLKNESVSPVKHLRSAVKRLGEPVIRTAVTAAMKEMGRQFVLGQTIQDALKRAAAKEREGFTYSYDMLGEAARSDSDAQGYYRAYSEAIEAIAVTSRSDETHQNPGISVKLSALHPRYELSQRVRVMDELVPRVRALALQAKAANLGFTIDAEEQDRLSLSLEIIEAVLNDARLEGWDGFGVVVQAYGPRAIKVIDTIQDIAQRLHRRLCVRLVKGAYWDTEIKQAQVEGLDAFPVFTSKAATDVSYIACARKLLSMPAHIYPQFATHNAHTVATVLALAAPEARFEFQKLHGMGDSLHELVMQREKTRCRIYAPVGVHRDLLAYLVRRLLENGANSSFVNQVIDTSVPATVVVKDPFATLAEAAPGIKFGSALFSPQRQNSRGYNLAHWPTLAWIDQQRDPFRQAQWQALPQLAVACPAAEGEPILNPSEPTDSVGSVVLATPELVAAAIDAATPWQAAAKDRAAMLCRVADLYEQHSGELFALLAREAGKTLDDCVGELREAVDFLRYYAAQVHQQSTETPPAPAHSAKAGLFACISPWNFPLAIFTGQIAAALVTGNAVLAKPAEQTPLIASRAVALFHQAGVPTTALQCLPGRGETVGAALVSNAKITGVAFTGSTQTARAIRTAMAENLTPGAPLIAETGGLNAMLVDSTALPEQAVQAVLESAFHSAGQRCSALRCLYIQSDIAAPFIELLKGAMNELCLGDPWQLATDCGPVIDGQAKAEIEDYIEHAVSEGLVLHRLKCPDAGSFIAPTLISVDGIEELEREVFGPVLHIATFKSNEINQVIDAINATGYGLTFGLQTRIDDRVQTVCDRIRAGNVYVNRNQIGAIVGSQPFGGEGLSGTGAKAGGPDYLTRFWPAAPLQASGETAEPNKSTGTGTSQLAGDVDEIRDENEAENSSPFAPQHLPGPTGESNVLTRAPRPPLLCLGPGADFIAAQAQAVESHGGQAIRAEGEIDASELCSWPNISAAIWWGDKTQARVFDQALATRSGPLTPLITGLPDPTRVLLERHVCIDTTASGGNTALLSGQESAKLAR